MPLPIKFHLFSSESTSHYLLVGLGNRGATTKTRGIMFGAVMRTVPMAKVILVVQETNDDGKTQGMKEAVVTVYEADFDTTIKALVEKLLEQGV